MAETPVIRSAQATDVEALSALAIKTYAEAFGYSFSAADLSDHLDRNLSPVSFSQIIEKDAVLLAEVGNHLIGYVQFGTADVPAALPEDRELRRLYVDSAFQNKGYGGLLLEAALLHPLMRSAANIYLDVWEHNPAAQRFYRRYGFEVIGKRMFVMASGVSDSCDLLMVRRSLPTGMPT